MKQIIIVLLLSIPALAHKANLVWGASSSPNVYYQVLRSSVHGGPYVMVKSKRNELYWSDTNVSKGQTWYYLVNCKNKTTGLTSKFTNEVKAVIPK